MKPTRKTKTHVFFEIQSNLRWYKYELKLTRRAGKFVHLKAGCRYWQEFGRADWHYDRSNMQPPSHVGGSREIEGGNVRWSDAWLYNHSVDTAMLTCRTEKETFAALYAQRAEARGILRRLRNAWCDYTYSQSRLRAKNRQVRRAREREARKRSD